MGSISRLPENNRDLTHGDHRIYVPFYSKKAATSGGASTFIECYNPSNKSWLLVTSIPGDNVLKDFAMVGLSHCIYVIGGRLCSTAAEDGGGGCEEEARAVQCVRKYDVRSGVWEACAPMSKPRFNFACAVSNGKIYVAGGLSTSGWAEGISSAEEYDPASGQWRSLADMTMARFNCAGVAWKGKIYVVGGFLSGRPFVEAVARSSVEVYDEKRDCWEFVPRMWNLDVPPNQIAVVNGKLFSSGDCLKSWKGHIEKYDENDNIWNIVDSSHSDSLSTGMLYLTMAPVRNRLYFVAGCSLPGEDSRLRSEVHVFDTTVDDEGWVSSEAVEKGGDEELCGHCCVLEQEFNLI